MIPNPKAAEAMMGDQMLIDGYAVWKVIRHMSALFIFLTLRIGFLPNPSKTVLSELQELRPAWRTRGEFRD